MADTPESKPPFWSSLPGIFTGIGGILVASTGLITALYTTGVIGSKANSNAVPPPNTSVTLVSTPAASPSPIAENKRYKIYEGDWDVTENPSLDFAEADEVKWVYKATVSGDILTMKGRVSDENSDLPEGADRVSSTIVVQLVDSKGMGEYRSTKTPGRYDLPVTLDDVDPPQFEASIQKDGKIYCLLKGKKL